MLHPLPLRWRPIGKFYRHMYHSFMQDIEHLVFGNLNIRVQGSHGGNCLVEWHESEISTIWSGKSNMKSEGCEGTQTLPSIYRLDFIFVFDFIFYFLFFILKFKMTWTNYRFSSVRADINQSCSNMVGTDRADLSATTQISQPNRLTLRPSWTVHAITSPVGMDVCWIQPYIIGETILWNKMRKACPRTTNLEPSDANLSGVLRISLQLVPQSHSQPWDNASTNDTHVAIR